MWKSKMENKIEEERQYNVKVKERGSIQLKRESKKDNKMKQSIRKWKLKERVRLKWKRRRNMENKMEEQS